MRDVIMRIGGPHWAGTRAVAGMLTGHRQPGSRNGDIAKRSVTAFHRPLARLIRPERGHLAQPANGAGCPAVARAAVTAKARERFSKKLFYFHMNRSRVGAWTESPFRGGPRRF